MVILAILNIFAPPPDVCPSLMWHAEDENNIDIGIHWIYALILTLGSGLGFRVLGFRVGLSLSGLSFWDVQQLWPDAGIRATNVFCCSIKTGHYQQEPAGQEMMSIPTTKCRQKGDNNSHLKFPTIRLYGGILPGCDGENTCQKKKTTSSGFGNINNSSCITSDIGNFYGLGLRIPFCTLGRDWTSKHKGTAYIGYRNPQVDRKEIRLSW